MLGNQIISLTKYENLNQYACNRDHCSLNNQDNLRAPRQVRIGKIIQSQYNLQPSPLITTTTTHEAYDNYGNPTRIKKSVSAKGKTRTTYHVTKYLTSVKVNENNKAGLKNLGIPRQVTECLNSLSGEGCVNNASTLKNTKYHFNNKPIPHQTDEWIGAYEWASVTHVFNNNGTLKSSSSLLNGFTEYYEYDESYPYMVSAKYTCPTSLNCSSYEDAKDAGTPYIKKYSNLNAKYSVFEKVKDAYGKEKIITLDGLWFNPLKLDTIFLFFLNNFLHIAGASASLMPSVAS